VVSALQRVWHFKRVAVRLSLVNGDKRIFFECHVDAKLGPDAMGGASGPLLQIDIVNNQILVRPNREDLLVVCGKDRTLDC